MESLDTEYMPIGRDNDVDDDNDADNDDDDENDNDDDYIFIAVFKAVLLPCMCTL